MELEVLGDRYELQEPIGRGGMATIYRALDVRMGRVVAAKILREVYSTDPKFVTRFQREAFAASALQHPNIVQVFDYGQSGESYYIVMEFIDGMDLRRYLKKNGILSNERAVEIAHDVALGLGAAHKLGIVHRDVKPQNVMLNDAEMVKLTDFGIASITKDAEAERLTTTGMTLGTVQYYAPEQAQGEIVAPAADIYALGIVLYEMLAGRTPFDGDTPVAVAMRHIQDMPEPPSRFNSRITPALERIILRCLEKDPRDRYRDGDTLAYALENYARTAASRRPTTNSGPAGRAPFAPLALPSTNGGRPGPSGGPAPYGGAAVASGPNRGGRGTPPPGQRGYSAPNRSASFNDDPTYDSPYGFGGNNEGALSTRPNGAAPGTLPRTPNGGRPGGPYGGTRSGPRGGGPNKRQAPIVAIVVASAVVLLGLTCFLVATVSGLGASLLTRSGNPTPVATAGTTIVPNFVGVQLDTAQALADSNRLKLNPKTVTDDTHPKGVVISQDPSQGTKEPFDYLVNVTVSAGKGQVAVPDVVGKTTSYATDKLVAVGLNYLLQYDKTSTQPAGTVEYTSPPAGRMVDAGSTVTLTISAPPTPTATPSMTATPSATATATATCAATAAVIPPAATPTPVPGC